MRCARTTLCAAVLATMVLGRPAHGAPSDTLKSDMPAALQPALDRFEYERRVVMVPMRDGVRLHTVIMIPKGAQGAPILLTRTPYNADKATQASDSTNLEAVLIPEVDLAPGAGYIQVVQDIRGKYGSEGVYVMNRPPVGPLNKSGIDETTDAWDTVDWLARNLPESNGRVGMIGGSYDGFLVTMALLDPHPALKVAVPIAPMIDGWRDDWFHYGAFRQTMMDYIYNQDGTRSNSIRFAPSERDEYDFYLRAGSAGELGSRLAMGRLGFWRELTAHPAYDGWWRDQAVDKLLAAKPLKTPTLWIDGLWDQEDNYGAPAAYAAVEPKDGKNDTNFIVFGPWGHMGVTRDGSSLGAVTFGSDTSLTFRQDYLRPFLDYYLRPGSPKPAMPPVLAFETGTNRWRSYETWPPSGHASQPLYLGPGLTVGFNRPARAGTDSYVSDPSKPVPYRVRPDLARHEKGSTWSSWLVDDQRPFSDRPDVLTYVGSPLSSAVKVTGKPAVDLLASTTGSDADWVVKLIDVYPDVTPGQPAMGGYQLPVAMEIFRGRYRMDPATPHVVEANTRLEYKFNLPTVNHVFLPGHRIMVQVQSSWFPLYDRNPQTFVTNMFTGTASYKAATQTVFWGPDDGSRIMLPLSR